MSDEPKPAIDHQPVMIDATFASVDFEQNTLTFEISTSDMVEHEWRAGTIRIDMSEIASPRRV